jgi:hypothetical protein
MSSLGISYAYPCEGFVKLFYTGNISPSMEEHCRSCVHSFGILILWLCSGLTHVRHMYVKPGINHKALASHSCVFLVNYMKFICRLTHIVWADDAMSFYPLFPLES